MRPRDRAEGKGELSGLGLTSTPRVPLDHPSHWWGRWLDPARPSGVQAWDSHTSLP